VDVEVKVLGMGILAHLLENQGQKNAEARSGSSTDWSE
jgi:hypothetical protein